MATNGMMPIGGLAEYAAVQVKFSGKAPSNVSPTEAAAFPNSSATAVDALKAAGVKDGDRVMVLGGSGGVGSSVLQLVKDAKVRKDRPRGRGRDADERRADQSRSEQPEPLLLSCLASSAAREVTGGGARSRKIVFRRGFRASV